MRKIVILLEQTLKNETSRDCTRKGTILPAKIFKFYLQNGKWSCIIAYVLEIGLSPNGKATDSDSVISRFESL